MTRQTWAYGAAVEKCQVEWVGCSGKATFVAIGRRAPRGKALRVCLGCATTIVEKCGREFATFTRIGPVRSGRIRRRKES